MGASWYCWWQHQSYVGLFCPLFRPLPPFVLLSGYQAHLSFLEANSLASMPPLLLSSLADHCGHQGPHSLPSGSHETLAFLEEGRYRVGGESSCRLLCLRNLIAWTWKRQSWDGPA